MQFPIATFQKFTCSLNKFQHPCKTILVTVNLMNELVYPFFIADESNKSETDCLLIIQLLKSKIVTIKFNFP